MQWLNDLHNQIAAVAPIEGLTLGPSGDLSTCIVHFEAGATDEQKVLANTIIASFTPYSDIPTITRRQCRLWVFQTLGKTKADIEAAIAAVQDSTAREIAQIEWEDSTEFRYDHPLIQQFAAVFGIADIPEAFRRAAAL